MPAAERRFRVRRTEPTTELFQLAGVYIDAAELERVRENVHAVGHVARVVRTRAPGAGGHLVEASALYVWAPPEPRSGRPRGGRRAGAEARTVGITVQLTPAEKRQVEERAARLGKEPAPFLRELALGSARGVRVVEVPAVNREAHQQIRKLGNNLNQVAARLNEAAADEERVELGEGDRALLAEIRREVLALQAALLGARLPSPGEDAAP